MVYGRVLLIWCGGTLLLFKAYFRLGLAYIWVGQLDVYVCYRVYNILQYSIYHVYMYMTVQKLRIYTRITHL